MFTGAYGAILDLIILALSTRTRAFHQKQRVQLESLIQHQRSRTYEVAITTIGASKYDHYKAAGSRPIPGIGNNLDLLYTVPIELNGKSFSLNLDTGSSDLWLISSNCHENACKGATVERYTTPEFTTTNPNVYMQYGDSKSGTFASGTIGFDTAGIAGIDVLYQPFGLIEDTSNLLPQFGASGIFGLGFPAASSIQAAFGTAEPDSAFAVDEYIDSIASKGPLLSRIAMSDVLDNPMFSISLQRHTNGLDGQGSLTVGNLPEGIDNSTLTWVPVRLYTAEDGGMGPPSYAMNEIYPYRWEIDIDAVFFDGKRLADSTIAARGVDSERVSALIDTGNSLLRGPEDVVVKILQSASPRFDPKVVGSVPSLPCNMPHTLAFQIGGKMFPIDPRDFSSQLDPDNAIVCQADNLVPTDPPSFGNLFRWSLGTPFFRSNIVAFHYGNLTHPSMDPPRIGLKSNVPHDTDAIMKESITMAMNKGTKLPQGIQSIKNLKTNSFTVVSTLGNYIFSSAQCFLNIDETCTRQF